MLFILVVNVKEERGKWKNGICLRNNSMTARCQDVVQTTALQSFMSQKQSS